jgi:CheY-like chemotaxis protein
LSKLILVVEDERDQRELLVELLNEEGSYRAVGAATAKAALEAVARECPALVLCDLALPDGDGRELCNRIREICPEPPAFVFLTGLAPTKTQDIGEATLRKPVDVESLLAMIERHASRRPSRPRHGGGPPGAE